MQVTGSNSHCAHLYCEDGPNPTPPGPSHCDRNQVPCANGVCIPADYMCDGDYDCTDRSDEANCGKSQFIVLYYLCTRLISTIHLNYSNSLHDPTFHHHHFRLKSIFSL